MNGEKMGSKRGERGGNSWRAQDESPLFETALFELRERHRKYKHVNRY
jgi:hypothetical protein